MKKLINASLLISGTAIGAGLIALPLMSVNLGVGVSAIIIIFMIFIAYQSSMMTIDLNVLSEKPDSIVKMSNKMSGRKAFAISLLSFYILSFSLLTAYFSGLTSSIKFFLRVDASLPITVFCGLGLFGILILKSGNFSRLNSFLVTCLLSIIAISLVNIHSSRGFISPPVDFSKSDLFAFLPIIFTSFGVQNICPYIYKYLEGDRKKINKAFLAGIVIPAFVYIIWIFFVSENVLSRDADFFAKLQAHQVSAGELINFLCESSSNTFMDIIFKTLSLLAIITSAIGIGLGLLKSIQETVVSSRRVACAVICSIPVLVTQIIPNAFIAVLSFGGIIATIFVIFMPYYLLYKMAMENEQVNRNFRKKSLAYNICLAFGIVVVLCEFLQKL